MSGKTARLTLLEIFFSSSAVKWSSFKACKQVGVTLLEPYWLPIFCIETVGFSVKAYFILHLPWRQTEATAFKSTKTTADLVAKLLHFVPCARLTTTEESIRTDIPRRK